MKGHIFIVTYGRTGSTLLQALLNTHPKVLILGENAGLHYQLFNTSKVLNKLKKRRSEKTDVSDPYFGIDHFQFDMFSRQLMLLQQNFFSYYSLEQQTQNIDYLGFKEINYDMPEIEKYLDGLLNTYKNTKLVFLTRNINHVLNSGFFKNVSRIKGKKYLELLNERFRLCHEKFAGNAFHVEYQELLQYDKFSKLCSFLKIEIDKSIWRETIAVPHSYDENRIKKLNNKSSFVILDSISKHIESYHFETNPKAVNLYDFFVLEGVLMPFEGTGKLRSLCLKNDKLIYPANINLPSPSYNKKYPNHCYAGRSRFSFRGNPVEISLTTTDLYLVAEFENTTELILGRLFLAKE